MSDQKDITGITDIAIAYICTNADLAGAPLHLQELVLGISTVVGRVIAIFGEEGPVRIALAGKDIETYIVPTMRSNINPLDDIRTLFSVKSILAKAKPDLIHAHSSKAGMVARILGSYLNIPVVYTIHGWGFGKGRRKIVSIVVRITELLLKGRTSHFIAVSDADKEVGINSLHISSDRISTVNNGIADCSLLANPMNSSVLVMVARNDHQKDYGTLFQAIDTLSCEVWCIGRGTDTADFKAMAKALAPSAYPRITFFGPRSDVTELLSKTGIFVLSSRFEGLPLSILEAMRAGLPVVASDVGGVCELVSDNITGFLFRSGDSITLRSQLSKLLENGELRARLGNSGRQAFVNCFTSKEMVSETGHIYSSILRARGERISSDRNPKKHKVVICNSTTWYTYNFRLPLIFSLMKEGYEVVVVAPFDDYTTKLRELGCETIKIDLKSWGQDIYEEAMAILQYYNIFASLRPLVILNFTPKPNIYGAFAARFLGYPCISNVAGLGKAYAAGGLLNYFVRLLYRFSQGSVHCIFFQNRDDLKLFVDAKIATPRQAKLLPGSGIELDKFSPRPAQAHEGVWFLLIARLIWEKGIGEYVEAARLVKALHPSARFQLIGYIDQDNPSAIPETEVTGWVNEGVIEWLRRQADVRPFIAEADCVVLPSYYREGTPRTLLEAASMAKPIIAADSIGCREPVDDGVNGFLCKPRDFRDLSEKMLRIIEMGSLERNRMGQAGRKKMEDEYDSSIVVAKYLEQIRSLVSENAK